MLIHEVALLYYHVVCVHKYGPQHFHLLSLWDGHVVFDSVQCSQYQVENAYCRPAVMDIKVLACTCTCVCTFPIELYSNVHVHWYDAVWSWLPQLVV